MDFKTTQSEETSEEFEPRFYFILATVLVVIYLVGCNIMFYFVNHYFKNNDKGKWTCCTGM